MGLMWPEIIHTFIKTEAFDDNLVVDIFKSLYEHAQSILHRFTVANWHIHELDGLGQLGIFYPVFKDSGEWYRTAVTRLYSEMKDQQVHPDGFHYELTPGYHGVVIHHVMAFAEVAEIYGKEVPSELYGVIENMLTVYVKLMQANGCIPNINDGGGGKADAMVRKYIRYFPDNKLFKWLTGNKVEGENNLDTALLFENCGNRLKIIGSSYLFLHCFKSALFAVIVRKSDIVHFVSFRPIGNTFRPFGQRGLRSVDLYC